ncbi:CHAT domain-containing protein [Maribacter hydrothermalis]|uniref:CHAT domain-containing protein n=1 Tax=Maribacter hydrothermalis TaxID=1836467 RepID=UPI0018DD2EA2|nr:CHAT domain-containing protein [Maribacter hydrothermalis]
MNFILLSGQDYKERLKTLEDKASIFFYTNKDSTYFYYNEMYQLALKEGDYITLIDNLNYVCFAAGYYYDTDKIKSTIKTIDYHIQNNGSVLDTLPNRGDDQINYLNYNKGNYYHKVGDYVQSQFYFEEIIADLTKTDKYKESADDLSFLSTCYSFIANINAEGDRFEVADEYYQKNIRLYKEYLPHENESLDKVYNLYASSLYTQKKYTSSKEIFIKTISAAEDSYDQSKRNSIVTTSLMLSKIYNVLGKIDSAYFYLNKIEKYKASKDPFNFSYISTKGDILVTENKLNEAIKTFFEALEVTPDVNKFLIYKKIGDTYEKQSLWDKALDNYQKGLINLGNDFNSHSFLDNPDPTNVLQKQEVLPLLLSKSTVLKKKGTHDDHLANFNVIETAIATIDLSKPSFKNDRDKAFLIENAYPLFESGMESTYTLYKTSENDYYIDEAFRYSEKSKSVLLMEALLSSQATEFANIPKIIREQENLLKNKITLVEKELTSSENSNSSLEDNLFSLNQELRNLIVDVETNYPTYFDLKYNSKILSLQDVQNNLTENELFVSWFYGNENIYAIAISKNKKSFQKIEITPKLEGDINDLHALLSNPKSNLDSLSKLSYTIYQKLLHPILKLHPQERIILAPDGLLNYIPFGSLVTNDKENRYLIEDRNLSYVNSATLWSQLNSKEQTSTNLLAFAPSFDSNGPTGGSRSHILGNLPHNKNEVEHILTSFKGKSFINDQATLQNFTSSLSDYSVLHLATHAVFDDENPEYSYLAFTPKKESDDLLFVKDLYNLTLNASLVTLSGCESGIGELKRGEGFLSLARGFFYSGAASISSTLWKVNDNSSANLMGMFYENLADGKTKDASLRDAKLSFLQKNRENGLAHPYYWSGYIIQGNTQPLVTSSKWQWYLYGGIIIVILIFLGRKKLVQFFK